MALCVKGLLRASKKGYKITPRLSGPLLSGLEEYETRYIQRSREASGHEFVEVSNVKERSQRVLQAPKMPLLWLIASWRRWLRD